MLNINISRLDVFLYKYTRIVGVLGVFSLEQIADNIGGGAGILETRLNCGGGGGCNDADYGAGGGGGSYKAGVTNSYWAAGVHDGHGYVVVVP